MGGFSRQSDAWGQPEWADRRCERANGTQSGWQGECETDLLRLQSQRDLRRLAGLAELTARASVC